MPRRASETNGTMTATAMAVVLRWGCQSSGGEASEVPGAVVLETVDDLDVVSAGGEVGVGDGDGPSVVTSGTVAIVAPAVVVKVDVEGGFVVETQKVRGGTLSSSSYVSVRKALQDEPPVQIVSVVIWLVGLTLLTQIV